MYLYDLYKIRALREDNDLTQKEVYTRLNIPKNTYIRYETGEVIPPFNIMIKIADLYGVSLDYLAGRSESPNMAHNETME